MGGMALHDGRLAEMATGEGKTLVAVLPVYLNALSGKINYPYFSANTHCMLGNLFIPFPQIF